MRRVIGQAAGMKSGRCAVGIVAVLAFGSVAWAGDSDRACDRDGHGLPAKAIEQIIEAQGTFEHGVFHLGIERQDIGDVQGPESVPNVTFTSSFEISGDLFFQPLGHGQAFLNGDMALREQEVNPFVQALIEHGIVWQAYHQHLPMEPQVWFVHFRATGDAIRIAKGIKAALDTTTTPFPQTMPSNPTTPLDPARLASILHGHASVGADGVVTVWVLRRDTVIINGVRVNPQANISTNIEFKPLGGSTAAVVPDFSMESESVQRVARQMLVKDGWYQGCLYNQETDEHPQLYFDHMLKTGDAYELARQIRRGLDLTEAE